MEKYVESTQDHRFSCKCARVNLVKSDAVIFPLNANSREYLWLYCCFLLCIIKPVDGVMDVVETLNSGATSIARVVDHIEGPTY